MSPPPTTVSRLRCTINRLSAASNNRLDLEPEARPGSAPGNTYFNCAYFPLDAPYRLSKALPVLLGGFLPALRAARLNIIDARRVP